MDTLPLFWGRIKLSRRVGLTLALALTVVIAVADYLTGPGASFALFYLVPVFLTSWFCRRWIRVSMAALCAGSGLAADLLWSGAAARVLVPYWNAVGRLGIYLFFSATLVTLKTALEIERNLARTDPLTEVANARSFEESVQAEIRRSRRYHRPLTLAYIDLDDFKLINDRHGHHAGDALLRTIAIQLKSRLRETDIVSRVGGDEFAVLLPEIGVADIPAAVASLETRFKSISESTGAEVTFSIGLVCFETPPESADEVRKAADRLMYAAKAKGKNRIEFAIVSSPREPSRPGLRPS